MNLITEQLGAFDPAGLAAAEARLGELDTGELRLYLDADLAPDQIADLEQAIISQGVHLAGPVRQDARTVVIPFQKRFPPLLLIGGAVAAALAASAGGIIGWQVWKTSQAGVPIWVWLVGGSALLYLALRKPVAQAGGLAIQAGKVYVGRKALGP